eukprot:CAMPEP_0113650256 /NCGR_PEP_ID=MMETSP0017_2-20120614/26736_1 /TAXON_ID=2856 /ORGANISM="Cylindrotheca closterium" /LENGTH=352 /DNA_ID=CAMNT_0000562745 /DNA_START=32 /DNA_END=1090 /DNA_ORIENTATION=+ /assembly_acc=CAM_ASM_000147
MSTADPSGFVRSPPSTYVKIINTARAEMNGQFGLILGYSEERSRYILVLCQTGAQAMLRPENLEPCSSMEQYQAQYQQIRNDPQVKQKIHELYAKAQQLLGGRKPEHAAGVIGLLLLFVTYRIGLSKMIMLFSLTMLLGLIVAPDIQTFGIQRWKLIVRNFPNRCRETIEQTVPQARGRVTNQMALGLVVIMILFAGRTLFASSGSPTAPPPPQVAANSAQRSLANAVNTVNVANIIEEAYKLGYNDATSSHPFGTASLAELKEQITTPPSIPDDIDYDYPPQPPPQKSGGGFGFGSLMSLFMIGRTCYQAGMTGDGNFDPQLLMVNLQLLPMPQKAILGFSVFNVLKAFVL